MKEIPVRKLIPVLTDIMEYRAVTGRTISYVAGMVKKYGDVCHVPFSGANLYLVHDPEMVKEILATQSGKFNRTRVYHALGRLIGNGLFTSDGDYHKKQRQLIKPAFYPKRIDGYADIMVQCAREEIDKWQDGERVNVNKAITSITLQVITKTLFGANLDAATIELVNSNTQQAFRVMNKIVQNGFYIYCLEQEIEIPVIRRFKKIRAELDAVINNIIAAYRRNENKDKMDLLSMLMEARDEETGEGMSDVQLRDEVMTFFVAGHESTTLSLMWTLYLLGRHPDVDKRFHEEVERVVGQREPVAADYPNLPLTKNIFKESLRIYPPNWTFARAATEPVTIRDYHFPKGAILWCVTYLLHHDARYYTHPEAFIPDRWDAEDVKDLPKYAYLPFGGGSRRCIGEGFAWMEGVLVLATIASRFRLKLPEGFTTGVNPVFTLKQQHNLYMTVEKK